MVAWRLLVFLLFLKCSGWVAALMFFRDTEIRLSNHFFTLEDGVSSPKSWIFGSHLGRCSMVFRWPKLSSVEKKPGNTIEKSGFYLNFGWPKSGKNREKARQKRGTKRWSSDFGWQNLRKKNKCFVFPLDFGVVKSDVCLPLGPRTEVQGGATGAGRRREHGAHCIQEAARGRGERVWSPWKRGKKHEKKRL